EPHTPRSRDMAKLMVSVFQDAVHITKKPGGKVDASISLAPDIEADEPEQAGKLPLVNMLELAYGPGLVLAHMEGLSLASLHKARLSLMQAVNKGESSFDWTSVQLFRWLRA